MSTFMNHCGAKEVDRDALALIKAPEATETWFPIAHSTVLNQVEETLDAAGFEIKNEWFSVAKDDSRFFGVLDLQALIHTDVSLSVGIRNSNDKTFPIGFCCGTRVFVCDNLSFSSEVVISKRHTKFGEHRYAEGIANAVASLHSFQVEEAERIRVMRDREVTEDQANSAILQSYEKGITNARLLPKLIEEWRSPSHDCFVPRTAWSLHNCFTEVMKPRFEKYPLKAAVQTMRFQKLLIA